MSPSIEVQGGYARAEPCPRLLGETSLKECAYLFHWPRFLSLVQRHLRDGRES